MIGISVKKAGLPPGTVVYTGKKKAEKINIDMIEYTGRKFKEKRLKKVEECFPFKKTPAVTWLNITGIHNIDIIKKVGKHFGIHPLVLEDIAHAYQRPKIKDFEKYTFMILKMIYHDQNKRDIITEQISLIIGKNFVISFQETEGDIFNPIRERLRDEKDKIRENGSDYLAYSLIDSIVDNYFAVLEIVGEQIENLEKEVVEKATSSTLHRIHIIKRDLIQMRKSVWPLREVISHIERGESRIFKKSTEIYLKDIYDHTIQIVDTVETFRDMATGMIDIYLSSISNKMNEVMKVLTIFATIFIPLTFITGIYGMNFKFMPELEWQHGYFVTLGVMAVVAIILMIYFARKKWL